MQRWKQWLKEDTWTRRTRLDSHGWLSCKSTMRCSRDRGHERHGPDQTRPSWTRPRMTRACSLQRGSSSRRATQSCPRVIITSWEMMNMELLPCFQKGNRGKFLDNICSDRRLANSFEAVSDVSTPSATSRGSVASSFSLQLEDMEMFPHIMPCT